MSERINRINRLFALCVTFLVLAACTRLARADGLAVVAAPGLSDTQKFFLNLFAPLLTPYALAALAAAVTLIPKGFQWLSAHTKIAKFAWADAVKDRFLGIVEHFVLVEAQTTVGTLKADFAAGKLTPTDYKQALSDVKERVIANALDAASQQNLLADVRTVLGVDSTSQLQAFAASAVEAAVARTKGPAAVAPANP